MLSDGRWTLLGHPNDSQGPNSSFVWPSNARANRKSRRIRSYEELHSRPQRIRKSLESSTSWARLHRFRGGSHAATSPSAIRRLLPRPEPAMLHNVTVPGPVSAEGPAATEARTPADSPPDFRTRNPIRTEGAVMLLAKENQRTLRPARPPRRRSRRRRHRKSSHASGNPCCKQLDTRTIPAPAKALLSHREKENGRFSAGTRNKSRRSQKHHTPLSA